MTSSDALNYELSWVHISDIHETGEPGAEGQHRKIIFQRLLEDLGRRSEIGAPDPDIIVVTGDVAMSGAALSPNEYREASIFLRSLVSRLGSGTRLMIVPGNHDIVRAAKRDAPTLRMLTAARDGAESLDDLLTREHDSALLEARLKGYKEFLNSLNDIDLEVSSGSVLTGWSRLIGGRTFQVRFVGLNTAVLANDDTDEGKLQLGYTQLRTASQEAASEIGMILLTHHPLEWLRDGDEASAIINEYFDLHLYGHLHLPQSRRSTLFQHQGLIGIGAGATIMGFQAPVLGPESMHIRYVLSAGTSLGILRCGSGLGYGAQGLVDGRQITRYLTGVSTTEHSTFRAISAIRPRLNRPQMLVRPGVGGV